jgi:hypothetical protein
MLSREHRSCKRAVLGTQSAASIIFARMEGQLITYGKQSNFHFMKDKLQRILHFKVIPFDKLTHCKKNSTSSLKEVTISDVFILD